MNYAIWLRKVSDERLFCGWFLSFFSGKRMLCMRMEIKSAWIIEWNELLYGFVIKIHFYCLKFNGWFAVSRSRKLRECFLGQRFLLCSDGKTYNIYTNLHQQLWESWTFIKYNKSRPKSEFLSEDMERELHKVEFM